MRSLTLIGLTCTLALGGCGSEDNGKSNATGSGGAGATAGSGGTGASAGSGATGATAGNGGQAGATGATCDLSGAGLPREDIPATIDGTTKLSADKVWTLKAETRVKAGGVLEIEPCTRIEGDGATKGALFVERGGKILAEGTADQPILFTSQAPTGSRQAGDWGGILILGKAPNVAGELPIEGVTNKDAAENKHGGNDPADNSGVLAYVRIEFSGTKVASGDELNGLSLGSVGSGTTIHHVMVNTTLDDCFEWFGGTVNAEYLVCNNGGDDMFDTDDGYVGTLKNIFGRHVAPNSEDPNGFEWDGTSDKDNPAVETKVTAQNVTLCGLGKDYAGGPSYGMVLRRGVQGTLSNNVVVGFMTGSVDARDDFGAVGASDVSAEACNFAAPIASTSDDDSKESPAIDETAWFGAGSMNTVDGMSFTVAECLDEAGPAAAVYDSGLGAFKDSKDWMQGTWISWTAN